MSKSITGKKVPSYKPVGFSRYEQLDPRRLQERTDFAMLTSDYDATANLPQKMMSREFDQVGYTPVYAFEDTNRN